MEKEKFAGYIKVTEEFYLKQVESHKVSYDVYQLKKSKSPRHPNGKIDDIAYGCSLPRALQLIAHAMAGQNTTNIFELIENIKNYEEEFLKKVVGKVKESK